MAKSEGQRAMGGPVSYRDKVHAVGKGSKERNILTMVDRNEATHIWIGRAKIDGFRPSSHVPFASQVFTILESNSIIG